MPIFPEKEEFLASLLAGDQVYVSLSTRKNGELPAKMESHSFEHVIERDGFFWGISSQEPFPNQLITGGYPIGYRSFCSTDVMEIAALWYEKEHVLQITPSYVYSSFCIKKKYLWDLVWDSTKNLQDISLISQAVQQGQFFKIAMLDSENVWNIHPVSLLTFSDNGFFEITTEYVEYPMLFRFPESLLETLNKNKVIFPSTFQEYKGENVFLQNLRGWPSFYTIHSDGSYCDIFDIPRNSLQKYKRLLIFSLK